MPQAIKLVPTLSMREQISSSQYQIRTYINTLAVSTDTHRLSLPMPMFPYGDSLITSSPWLTSAEGAVLSFDFGRWSFFDHHRGRQIGTVWVAGNPDDEIMWTFARRYVAEARQFGNDGLAAWIRDWVEDHSIPAAADVVNAPTEV